MNQTEALKAMIDRMQQGEMLQQGGAYAQIFARIKPGKTHRQDEIIEKIVIDEEDRGPSTLIGDMVERGELLETSFCSHWIKPDH